MNTHAFSFCFIPRHEFVARRHSEYRCNCILAPGVAQGWQVLSVQEAQVCSGWDSELEDNWGSPDPGLEHSEPSFLVPGLVTSEEQPALTLSPGDRAALGQTRPGHKTKTKTPFDTQQLASSRAQTQRESSSESRGGSAARWLQCVITDNYYSIQHTEKPTSITSDTILPPLVATFCKVKCICSTWQSCPMKICLLSLTNSIQFPDGACLEMRMTRHSKPELEIGHRADVSGVDNVWSEPSSQHTSLNGITAAESFRRREVRG